MAPTQAVEIFFSYSQEDAELREKLAKHLSSLKQNGEITAWYDHEVAAGTERSSEILNHLNSAHIILLLISSDFLASDYCTGVELKRAMERHEAKEARVIPIKIRSCYWKKTPFSHLQCLPINGKPIKECGNEDAAFAEVVEAIQEVVDTIGSKQQLPEIINSPEESQKLRRKQNPQGTKKARHLNWRYLRNMLLASMAITTSVTMVRLFGVMQPLELWTYDLLVQQRPSEEQDKRILIIEVDADDILKQDKRGEPRRGALSDVSLLSLLTKLKPYNPRAIGLDIYRDFDTKLISLKSQLQRIDNFFAVCKVRDLDANERDRGTAPPPTDEVPAQRVGFSDFVDDGGRTVRRHYLSADPDPKYPCQARDAFSLMLAKQYLKAMKEKDKQHSDDPLYSSEKDILRFGNVTLKRLGIWTGSYKALMPEEVSGDQTLLNYRSSCDPHRLSLCSPEYVSMRVNLEDVLDKNKNILNSVPNINERVILIGINESTYETPWLTPYSQSKPVPGVIIQAQMISQLLSAVLDGRPLLWVWSWWQDVVWIGFWSFVGGGVAWIFRSLKGFIIAGGFAFGILYGSCLLLLIGGAWAPLFPATLAFFVTVPAVKYVMRQSR